MRKALICDYFFTSSNALIENRILVNIDENRIVAMSFDPEKIIMIIGMNKVVKTLYDANSRVRTIVAPTIVQKFEVTTLCKKIGNCYNYKNLDIICCQILITCFNQYRDRLNIILVQEEIGI